MIFGPTFIDEVRAAGLGGLAFGWSPDGTISGRDALTSAQQATLDAVIAAHDANRQRKNTVSFPALIARFTDAEYQSLMQKRAQVLAAAGTVSMFLIKQFDQAMSMGSVDLNTAAAQTFKTGLVTAAILTQARADVIFA